ncbi:peroxisome proliferator-activated receptor gamma coactivator-related protein 1 [Xiphias gladius]|uniref:peroxisome proliferator-activated receptor gamma coactivator-related protein 1 n=1 Tax=Xiphias gladius TaxID=8245 RepID=UPI001A985C65|nr:peroxisome proliferator-activated receptor gamma coactivator-related protein 1 [Xiphias gladius]
MAARWGAGEETLTACNMDFFPMDTLDETVGLSSGETLEALQSCLDPSILSIFEEAPTIETKGLDEESEATLLTALTEILDNVDDENLSPFDTLPDSDLLSGQKGREHSPLRRLLCLSRSPPEKDILCSTRPISTGKSLPRIQADSLQRSDGEEEDDGSLTLSPVRHDSSPDNDLLDWEGPTLPLPVTFEQEGEDGVSVSLGDFVRHMHPYCMAICVENDDGEQMLPEGGILLEVVDRGENGEPILAIPDIDLPVSLPLKEQSSENEQKLRDEASDSLEHIVIDDEDVTVSEAPVKLTAPATSDLCSEMKDAMIKRQKEEIKEKSPSWRKKKKKYKEQCQPEPVEARVLRSGKVRKMAQNAARKPEKGSVKEVKKHKVPKVPLALTPTSSSLKPKKQNQCQTETEIATTTLLPEMNVQIATFVPPRQDAALLKDSSEQSQPSCSPTAVRAGQPGETPKQPGPAPEKLQDSSAAPSAVLAPLSSESPAAADSPLTPQMTQPVCEALPPVATAVPEPKPKSLSLEEYRRLRQQKKPAPVEKQDKNSTKWPSLPELPKELPPIPCLPDPSPRDPRRPNPQATKKEVDEVRPAWQPRGPTAPPTPEALLVPPAYMVASSSKVSAATSIPKPQQTPEPSKPSLPQNPSAFAPNSVMDLPSHQQTIAQPAVPSVPQSPESPAALKHATQVMLSADGRGSPALSGGKCRVDDRPQAQPVSFKSIELTKTCPKTTTESIKSNAATSSALSAPQKTTVVSQKVPEVTAATTLINPITADSKSSKPTANGTQLSSSSAAHPPDSHSLKAEPVVLETKENLTTAEKPQKAKSPTQVLIEAFTSEIGIEAADLTSLLEQFEETQAKEEQCVPEVSGRAAAVGNSSFELAPEKTVVERVRANDLSSTAALTPPATPPHQMWKPLAPVALLGKSKATEAFKPSTSKVIQIEARPLPSVKSRSKPTPATVAVDPDLACMDHDYCLPNKGTSTGESGKRWNVKQQSFITIKPIKQPATPATQTPPAALALSVPSTTNPAVKTKIQGFPLTEPLDHRTDGVERSSVLETPDASPARQETDSTVKEGSPRRGPFGRAYRRHAASRSPSPRSSPKERTGGRSRKRRSHHSPSPMTSGSESDSHSSRSRSRSRAPSKKRYRPRHSESSSSSSSRSSSRSSPSVSRSPPRRRNYSYSSSRSGSWSRSRSRSQSPQRQAQWSRSRTLYSPSYKHGYGNSAKTNVEEVKRRKGKAIEERRVVYVGRIRGTMTQKELKERFSLFGEIEDCTLHFRDHGDNYGFVTYYDTKDAFTAIENGSKLRKPDELPFDLCFGGRRQFCQTGYSDLDSSREYDPLPVKGKFHALDFDTLLKQAQQNLKR